MAIEKKQVKTITYQFMKDVPADKKCPPQALLIIKTVKESPGGFVTRPDLLALLKRPPAEGGLTTNQTAERILGFYRNMLCDELGVVKEDLKTEEIEVEVPDKPAKEPKAEGEGKPAGEKSKGKKGEAKSAS